MPGSNVRCALADVHDKGIDNFISAADRHGVYMTRTSGGGTVSGGQTMTCKVKGSETICIIKKNN